jgi:two-component system, OmpR family, sensor kinase
VIYLHVLENFEPDTEVGRLSTSLNIMLSRIEESFAVRTLSENKLRRFVADASHELRTPLTAIRGFAELHRQGAVPEGEKTKELISRIEKESIRMGYLVEDLLMLARLDQSRELVMDEVDLSALVNEAVTSAAASGPDHKITSEIASGVKTFGDSDKIYQVVTNLLANARAHTPAGTLIKVSVGSNQRVHLFRLQITALAYQKRIRQEFLNVSIAWIHHDREVRKMEVV